MNTQVKIIFKMKELNLYRIWQIMNKVSEAQDKIAEKERIKADIDRLNKQLEKYD